MQDYEIADELRRMGESEPLYKPATRYRLMAAGLLAISADSRPEFRVPAYGPFLLSALS